MSLIKNIILNLPIFFTSFAETEKQKNKINKFSIIFLIKDMDLDIFFEFH